jgi:predicted nucleic acid-binding protein
MNLSLPPHSASLPRKIVFDTNVLLSLFAFSDSQFAPLRAKIEVGEWLAYTDDDCLAEFRRVLAYPQFGFDQARQDKAYADYLALAHCLPISAKRDNAAAQPLPRCKDRDDQKFLELARDAEASWLLSSDKAVLRVGRAGRIRHLYEIIKPDEALRRVHAMKAEIDESDESDERAVNTP